MADNQNNSMYTVSQYGHIDNNQNNNQTSTQANLPNKDLTVENLMANLQQQSHEQSQNLINQREIINKAFEENKKLQTLLAQRDAEIEQLKTQSNNTTNTNSSMSNLMYEEQMKSMQQQLDTLQQNSKMQALVPVVEEFKKFGIKETDVKEVLSQIKNLGVDLYNNPNPELAKLMLGHLYGNANETQSVPQGGFSQTYNNNQNYYSAEANQYISDRNKTLEAEIAQKRQNQRK